MSLKILSESSGSMNIVQVILNRGDEIEMSMFIDPELSESIFKDFCKVEHKHRSSINVSSG